MKKAVFLMALLVTPGCATGKFVYSPPTGPQVAPPYSKVLEKSREEVWKELIPAIGNHFWVINNLDKSSGLINLSYSGDPQKYVDCGTVSSYVSNAHGPRTYSFPGSIAEVGYETVENNNLILVQRTMNLDGRINLILEEIDPGHTKVTVNTRYILNKTSRFTPYLGTPVVETLTFNSGDGAKFGHSMTVCYANGHLESSILQLLQR